MRPLYHPVCCQRGDPVLINDIKVDRIFIACGRTDMRRSIDGLASIVQERFDLDPFSSSLFLFCGRDKSRIKALFWEGDGFILLYKRYENGAVKWPKDESEVRELTPQQLRWLLEGLSVDQPKAVRKTEAKYVL